MRHACLRIAVLALAFAGATGHARAASPEGTWLTQTGETKVRIGSCGSNVCGTIVWLEKPGNDEQNPDPAKRDRPLVGSQILYDLKPAGADRWEGKLYNYLSGKTYSGSAELQGSDKLKLSGCVLGGLFCRSQTWTRVK